MFSDLNLKSTYSTYENDIGAEFYTPVLSHCTHYDRATAYFSAKALASYAKGLELFSMNGYKYRLIISSEISEEDYEEIKKGYRLRDTLRNDLINRLNEPLTIEEECNLSNLAFLISIGTIDIKMAFTQKGIFHDKFGIMKDASGNIICFRGSNNETEAAFRSNYESFDITCSWKASDFDYSKITKSIGVFENLWANKINGIHVCDVDEIIYKKILSYNKGNVTYEPNLLESNCLILDYNDENLELNIKIDPTTIWNNQVYKLKLKRYSEVNSSCEEKMVFKKHLTYPKYKKIINILEADSKKRNYKFFVSKRLKKYISSREIYIYERANIGMAIKQQSPDVFEKFSEYKKIVDNSMDRRLRDKQMWDSFYMCIMRKSGNFSVPGSGKTSSVLGVFAYLTQKNLVNKIVMVGPKNSFGSWIDEFNICFEMQKGLKLFNIQSYNNLEEKRKAVKYDTGNKNLLLFNYESLNSVLYEVKNIVDDKTLLVFDEVHKVKAINGQRAVNALAISKNAYFTIAMTGTPIPNSYLDIKNLLTILYHDEYDEFFGFSEQQLKNPSSADMEDINNKIQPFFCRTTKQQLNVPNANEDIFLTINASENENKIFQILILKYAKNKLALIIRLLQLESNPQMLLKALDSNGEDFSDILDTSGEIEDIEFKDYSEEIISLIQSVPNTRKFSTCIEQAQKLFKENKPVIIWCIFVDSILRLSTELESEGLTVGCVYGAIHLEERDAVLKAFKAGKVDVLITNPHTLAESVSLHSICHDAIYFEYSYNLVHLLQSKDRIHRLGLPQNQYTQYFYLQNNFFTLDNEIYSLDKQIYQRLQEKEKNMLDAIENNILEQVATVEEDLEIIFSDLKL
ncbi:SNF2-related protein [Neobacillus sp. NPDC093127]|uniref:SNF2-related protein n=1 Tax=Neobacillus sp. NPDC093127 TaxID=3364296 RepID=UPI00380CFFC8